MCMQCNRNLHPSLNSSQICYVPFCTSTLEKCTRLSLLSTSFGLNRKESVLPTIINFVNCSQSVCIKAGLKHRPHILICDAWETAQHICNSSSYIFFCVPMLANNHAAVQITWFCIWKLGLTSRILKAENLPRHLIDQNKIMKQNWFVIDYYYYWYSLLLLS